MKYTSNATSVISRIKNLFSKDKLDSMYLELAQSMYAENLRRVHNDGKDRNGFPIGHYSERPIYAGTRGVRSFPLKGKKGKATFKNGKSHKTAYFKSGYLGFKKQIGFGSKVNLQVTGRLRADFTLLKVINGYVIGFASKYGKKISEGQEDHWRKPIWGVTERQRKINAQIVKRHLTTAK